MPVRAAYGMSVATHLSDGEDVRDDLGLALTFGVQRPFGVRSTGLPRGARHRAPVPHDNDRPGLQDPSRIGLYDRAQLLAVMGVVKPVVGRNRVEPGHFVDFVFE